MHAVHFLQDLAVVMIVAGIVTLIFHRLKQPVVLGYILAGFIIGPHTPPFPLIKDEETIRTLADLGVVFLLFSLGLEFNLRKLKQVGGTAFIIAACEILLMMWAGIELGLLFGWRPMDRVFLGAILCISSTTIIIKSLRDSGRLRDKHAEIIAGVLIVEDIFVILMMVLLTGLAKTGEVPAGEVAVVVLRLFTFLVAAIVLGLLVVPRLLRYVARYNSDEMLLISVLGLCFGVSLLALKLEYSEALGAFIIGALIAESREIGRVEKLIEPIRDLFSAVFFVAIGLLIDPAHLAAHPAAVAIIAVVFVGGKVLACSFGSFVAGCDAGTSLRVGTGMAQIGEFSFILASLGLSMGVTSDFLYPIAVAVAAVTALGRPYLVDSADGLLRVVHAVVPRPVANVLQFYHRWVSRLGSPGRRSQALRLVQSLVWQITLNITLIAGFFIAAAFAARVAPPWLAFAPERWGGARLMALAAAALVSLPLYIATIRKMEAMAMMLSEISVAAPEGAVAAGGIRKVLTNILFLAMLAGLSLFTLVMTSALLPPWHVLVDLLLILGVLVAFFSAWFNRWYSRAKFAIVETWNQPPREERAEPRPMPALLKDAEMDTVTMGAVPNGGRLIGEMELRSRTGASIVAIEREGRTLVNPGPDDEIRAGDKILLLGSPEQLVKARKHLAGS